MKSSSTSCSIRICLAGVLALTLFTTATIFGDPLPAVHSRGKLVLLVDETLSTNVVVEPKIERLIQDLVGDGWRVLRHDVERGPGPISQDNSAQADAEQAQWAAQNGHQVREMRALIKADYDASPTEVKAVFLLGHVAVPYSGDSRGIVGGHTNHWGAHPADTFYGEMSSDYGKGGWSDFLIDNSFALTSTIRYSEDFNWMGISGNKEILNIPGDGKFDQNYMPSPMTLSVGRVDLYNMPAFGTNQESTLISKYLDKDHDFRNGIFQVPAQAWLAGLGGQFYVDPTPYYSLLESTNIFQRVQSGSWNWFPFVGTNGYLLGYGSGYGSFSSAGGIGFTSGYYDSQTPSYNNFLDNDSRVVFVNLFGSHFGDWNQQDDFLRAPLANPYDPTNGRDGYGLAVMWASVDTFTTNFPELALGGTIGESLFASYTDNLHYALMGDPALRLHTVLPPANLVSTISGTNMVNLSWTPSADTAATNFNIYHAPTSKGPFVLANTGGPVTGSNYSAVRAMSPAAPDNFYMVRTVKTESNPCGSYINMSVGLIGNAPGGTTPYLNISQEPANQIVTGDTRDGVANAAAFTVEAFAIDITGNEQITYQWFKNGTSLSNDGTHIIGANTRALLIKGVQPGDQANYSVIVSNGGNSVTSASASLIVDPTVPIANDDVFNLASTAPVDLDVLANDSDPDQAPHPLAIASVSGLDPLAGALTINSSGTSIQFVPNTNWTGPASFSYVITDGLKFSPALVSLTLPQKVFPIKISGTNGETVLVSATDDFVTWTSLGTIVLSDNSFGFIDSKAGSFGHRFYSLKHVGSGATDTVGFVNLTVPGKHTDGTGGQAWIANQLNNPLGNTLAVLLPSVPAGTVISKYDHASATYSNSTYSGSGWSSPNMTLNPGEGAKIQNPNMTPLSLTFTGSVPTGSHTVSIASGFSLVSSVSPQSADLSALGFPAAQDDDQFMRFSTSSQQSELLTFAGGGWADSVGNPATAAPAIGEAFFINNASTSTRTLTQSFSPACSTIVKLSSPIDDGIFVAPASISLSSTASSDAGIAQVNFYHDNTLIGTGTGSGVYDFTWTNVAAGTYDLTAKATDSNGMPTVSLPVKIIVASHDATVLSGGSISGANFQFTIHGVSGAQVDVLATEDFVTWTDLGDVLLVGGVYNYLDAMAGNYAHRFYSVKNTNGCSINSLGFIKLTVPGKHADGTGGRAYFANQLNNPLGNTLAALLPSVPSGTVVSKYDASRSNYDSFTFSGGAWSAPEMTLNPGEGASIQNPGTNLLEIVFTGNVPTSLQNLTITNGLTLLCSAFPTSMAFGVPGFPAAEEDEFYRFNPINQQWDLDYVFFDGVWWSNITLEMEVPMPAVGEAFFISSSRRYGRANWTQTPPPLCPPVVGSTSPLGGAIYLAPASISLSATAASEQGIASVKFYNDGTLIGTGTGTGPYLFTWSPVAAGTYTVTAQATDSNGVTTVSLPLDILVASSNAMVLRDTSLSGSGLQFTINGVSGAQVNVFATENFDTWTNLGQVTLTGGTYNYLDATAGGFSHRFYSVGSNGVYSVNTVGFVNVTVPGKHTDGTGGQVCIANQLNNPLGNTLAVLLPGAPAGTVVSKYVYGSGNYGSATMSSGSWSYADMALNPGEGAIVQNPNTTPLVLTFTGNVPSGLQAVKIATGNSLVSSSFPRSVDLNVLGFPGSQDDGFLRFNTGTQQWDMDYGFDSGAWADAITGNPAVPVPEVGEGFFISHPSAPVTWSKNLSASP